MAKKKAKNINQMKEALLSNADFIKSHESEPTNDIQTESIIDDEILDKFEALAAYENTEASELINKALKHFLRVKGLQVEMALKARDNK